MRRLPPIKRPAMKPGPKLPTEEPKPGQAGVGGFRHTTLTVKVKHRLGPATHLGQPSPMGVTAASRRASGVTVADAIYAELSPIRGPVALEVVKKGRPISGQTMLFEVALREREGVVDTNQCRRAQPEFGHQPLSQTVARPKLPRSRGR